MPGVDCHGGARNSHASSCAAHYPARSHPQTEKASAEPWRRYRLATDRRPGIESVIRHSPPVARATAPTFLQPGIQSPYIPTAAIESAATVLVMDVAAFTGPAIAGWLRQRRCLTGEESPAAVHLLRFVTGWTGLDAHGVIGVCNVMEMHRAAGQPHRRLNALTVPP